VRKSRKYSTLYCAKFPSPQISQNPAVIQSGCAKTVWKLVPTFGCAFCKKRLLKIEQTSIRVDAGVVTTGFSLSRIDLKTNEFKIKQNHTYLFSSFDNAPFVSDGASKMT
jgi:hypothetical protein